MEHEDAVAFAQEMMSQMDIFLCGYFASQKGTCITKFRGWLSQSLQFKNTITRLNKLNNVLEGV